jgi:hypothetical protein
MSNMLPRASLLLLLATTILVSCDWANGSSSSDDPMDQPEFLTPVAEAQDAGVEIWWLGPEFEDDGLPFGISGVAQFESNEPDSGLGFQYSGHAGDQGGGVDVWSYSEDAGGASHWREPALRNDESGPEAVLVGPWTGELFSFGSGSRPVNQVELFVDVGSTTVVVVTLAGSTGVPGTDVNPLIDSARLVEVVAQGLRPYPE